MKRKIFTCKRFTGWVVRGVVHGLILFSIPLYSFHNNTIVDASGRDQDMWYAARGTHTKRSN